MGRHPHKAARSSVILPRLGVLCNPETETVTALDGQQVTTKAEIITILREHATHVTNMVSLRAALASKQTRKLLLFLPSGAIRRMPVCGQPSGSNRKEAVNMYIRMLPLSAAALCVLIFAAAQAVAQKKYDPGATDSEIKIGNIVPYTGKFSEYGAIGRAEAAYFQMINDRGGVNGRKINFISVDSGSDSSKSVALVHQLVEEDQVLLTVGIWGSSSNLAIRAYLNEKNVPQLFVNATESAFDDPSHFPWTMGFQASERTEGLVYAKYILQNKPGA
jgi:hypothetical protein